MKKETVFPLLSGKAALGGVAWVFALFTCVQMAVADTHVSGEIETDTNWDLAGSPYIVKNDIHLVGNATLTINPGVEVRFDPGMNLWLGSRMKGAGTLVAQGTEDNKIRFTTNVSGNPWGNIGFSVETGEGTIIRHAIIENGGSRGQMILFDAAADVTIENSTIRNSYQDAVHFYGYAVVATGAPTLRENHYEDNGEYPFRITISQGHHAIAAIDGSNTFTGNGDNRIYYEGGTLTADTVMKNPGIPYYLASYLNLDNATLTIEPGTELQFSARGSLMVGASSQLIAEGTEDSNIKFISSWPMHSTGIMSFSAASEGGVIENAVIERLEMMYIDGGSPVIRSSTIRGVSEGFIIFSSAPQIYCNNILANTVGFDTRNDAAPQIYNNNIVGNTRYGIHNINAGTIMAENNYWGAADGPSGNGPGSGDAIAGGVVDFDPFLSELSSCTVPVNASFTATPVQGCQALTVQFADNSTGVVSEWEWDFDNDGTIDSTEKRPSHTYAEPGTYTVTLTVYEGDASSTTSTDITVSKSVPTANFSAQTVSGELPLNVAFVDQSQICGTDSIVAWSWDFDNDGTPDSSEQHPAHVFDQAGYYTVSLTVTDTDGDSDTVTKEDYVYVSEPCSIYYYDADADGYGTDDSQCLTSPSFPYTAEEPLDCDDGNVSINPDAAEVCGDGIDNNCDGNVDEGECVVDIPGDLDSDADVDGADFRLFLSTYNKSSGTPGFIAEADYNQNGWVGFSDFLTWSGHYISYLFHSWFGRH